MELERFMFKELYYTEIRNENLMEIHPTTTFYKSGFIISESVFSFLSDNPVYVCSRCVLWYKQLIKLYKKNTLLVNNMHQVHMESSVRADMSATQQLCELTEGCSRVESGCYGNSWQVADTALL